MNRLGVMALVLAGSVAGMPGQERPAPADPAALEGTWAINRELSQFPRDVGFGMDVIGSGASGDPAGVSSGNPRALTTRPQSQAEALNMRQIIDEVRNPPARLTITQADGAVTLTDDRGRSRTLRPTGREEMVPLDAGPMAVTTRWEGSSLVVRYKVDQGREVRVSYSRKADPPQLVVQSEFLERGGHDTIVRIYEPAPAAEALPFADPASLPRAASPVAPAPPAPPAGAADPNQALVPAVPGAAAGGQFDQSQDAELKGLTALGVVVEEPGSEAASCGLRQDAIEAAVTKSLTDAGIRVVRNSDEDSYVYVRVVTAATSTGFCFSRYDAFVYSHTTATLSYGSRPVLVQVSLLNQGGITGGGASSHGATVIRAISQYVDQMAARIRAANR